MTCSNCGAANEAGRKFCLECGQPLSTACPRCGSANTPGAKFCGECGLALSEAAAPAAAAASPATERRLVSVLFADLVGFTTLSEARDAEDVRELLAGYFDTCRAIVDRYGGTVEKFIGDAVMAVWGTPIAQEDDAERAVRAALDLVEAIRRMGTENGVPDLALRAAVHTGEAIVTIGASGMGMVAGDLVNTASRLQSVAAPGTVLVGEGTQRAASEAIDFEPAGDHDLKGKASPVPAFRALRVVAQRGGVGRSDALEPPFVGRETELRLIKDFYHATARDRGPRLVSVIGQAGIGKSRLAWEFLKYIDGVTELAYWHQGRSPSYGDGISFWALAEMVRLRIGVSEGADEASVRERVAASLDEFVTDADERRSIEEPLLHLLGIEDGPKRERGQLFVAWRTFFERIADKAPVIMVFEDLQWADDGMLDFIEELVTWSRGRSIYIITLSRPELADRRPTWGAGQRSFTSLNLAALTDEDMRTLLAGLVPGLPEPVVDQIVRRAEGIPLYAVETVRTLLNDGRIQRDGDAYRPTADLSQMTVPESLQALIAARIDALPPPERTLVQDAAVLGLSFGSPAVQAVARSAEDQVEPMLRHLVQREIFTIDDDPRSPERGQFRFVQGLLREVAYGTLSRDDRRARHLAAARYYEALGDEELSGVLAQHYVDAYRAHPDGPEGTAVATQARVALRGAAQRAGALGSHRLAHGYLESALLVVTDAAEELELRTLARRAAAYAALLERAVEHGERAIELAQLLGLDADRRRAIASLADILLEGHQQRSLQLLNDAMAEPGMGPEAAGYVEVATLLAKAEMRSMNDARAVALADQVLPVAHDAGDDYRVLDLLITRGVALANMGRLVEPVAILTGALDLAKRLSLPDMANRASVNLSYALAHDDPARAMEVSRAAIEEAKQQGVVWGLRYILGNAVDGAIEVGEWEWATEAMAELEALFTEPAERIWFGTYGNIIRAYRGEDVHDAARTIYETSREFDDNQYLAVGAYGYLVSALTRGEYETVLKVAGDGVNIGGAGIDGAILGVRAAVWSGDVAAAIRLRDAFAQAGSLRRNRTLLAAMDGGIAMLEGRTADARVHYAEAQRLAREIEMPFMLGLIDLDIAVTGAMEPAERGRAIDEAREIFTRLRADALLQRLDAAAGSAPEAPPRSARTQEIAQEA